MRKKRLFTWSMAVVELELPPSPLKGAPSLNSWSVDLTYPVYRPCCSPLTMENKLKTAPYTGLIYPLWDDQLEQISQWMNFPTQSMKKEKATDFRQPNKTFIATKLSNYIKLQKWSINRIWWKIAVPTFPTFPTMSVMNVCHPFGLPFLTAFYSISGTK